MTNFCLNSRKLCFTKTEMLSASKSSNFSYIYDINLLA